MSNGSIKNWFFNKKDDVSVKLEKDKKEGGVNLVLAMDVTSGQGKFQCEVRSFPCLIGRMRECKIFLPDTTVGRNHATISFINGSFFITDNGSKNGLIVSGQIIPENGSRRLYEGDIILLGKSQILIRKIIIE